MDKLQLFFSNFYRMTFEDKGAFWGIVLAITLLVLTYAFSEKLRHLLKRKTKFLILVPVLLLACFALLLANSCKYVPLSERSEPNTVSYEWEQRIKKTENTLIYRANLRDPSTGSAREQSYAFGEILGRFSSKETSDHVAEEYTIISSDKGSSMTFTPDVRLPHGGRGNGGDRPLYLRGEDADSDEHCRRGGEQGRQNQFQAAVHFLQRRGQRGIRRQGAEGQVCD